MSEVDQKVGLVVATAMSVTIIVGAGLLTLPGLTFSYAGRLGYLPWLIVSVLMVPLLFIFSFFARAFPSAGGVVGYVRASLGGRLASVSEMIVLGTFTLGIPAISLIGADYLKQVWPELAPQTIAIAMLTLALLAGAMGLRVSGALQTAIAVSIVLGLLFVISGFLWVAGSPTPYTEPFQVGSFSGALLGVPLVLFAFTGWEMTAFLAEDMRDPSRDLPRSIWASFAIVVMLYLLIAWVVSSYANNDSRWIHAPVLMMAQGWLGSSASNVVGVMVAVLVQANVVAAFTSASRAIFSAGRDGLLLSSISETTRSGNPLVAMLVAYLVFVGVVMLTYLDSVSVSTLLQLAGQNFFVLYLFCALGYVVLYRKSKRRYIGYLSAMSVIAAMALFTVSGLIYCGLLGALGYYLSKSNAVHMLVDPEIEGRH